MPHYYFGEEIRSKENLSLLLTVPERLYFYTSEGVLPPTFHTLELVIDLCLSLFDELSRIYMICLSLK